MHIYLEYLENREKGLSRKNGVIPENDYKYIKKIWWESIPVLLAN